MRCSVYATTPGYRQTTSRRGTALENTGRVGPETHTSPWVPTSNLMALVGRPLQAVHRLALAGTFWGFCSPWACTNHSDLISLLCFSLPTEYFGKIQKRGLSVCLWLTPLSSLSPGHHCVRMLFCCLDPVPKGATQRRRELFGLMVVER